MSPPRLGGLKTRLFVRFACCLCWTTTPGRTCYLPEKFSVHYDCMKWLYECLKDTPGTTTAKDIRCIISNIVHLRETLLPLLENHPLFELPIAKLFEHAFVTRAHLKELPPSLPAEIRAMIAEHISPCSYRFIPFIPGVVIPLLQRTRAFTTEEISLEKPIYAEFVELGGQKQLCRFSNAPPPMPTESCVIDLRDVDKIILEYNLLGIVDVHINTPSPRSRAFKSWYIAVNTQEVKSGTISSKGPFITEILNWVRKGISWDTPTPPKPDPDYDLNDKMRYVPIGQKCVGLTVVCGPWATDFLHAHESIPSPDFYQQPEYKIKEYLWFYLPLAPDEKIQGAWLRYHEYTSDRSLILATTIGKQAKFAPWLAPDLEEFCTMTPIHHRGSTIDGFYYHDDASQTGEFKIGATYSSSLDSELQEITYVPEQRLCRTPYIGGDHELYYSQASLKDVQAISLCSTPGGKCIGIRLQYPTHEKIIGQWRYDYAITKEETPCFLGYTTKTSTEDNELTDYVLVELSTEYPETGMKDGWGGTPVPWPGMIGWWCKMSYSFMSLEDNQ